MREIKKEEREREREIMYIFIIILVPNFSVVSEWLEGAAGAELIRVCIL